MERSDFTASRQASFANFDAEKYLGCPRSTVEIVNCTMYIAQVIIARECLAGTCKIMADHNACPLIIFIRH